MKNTKLIWTLSLVIIAISFAMIGIHWNDLPEQVPMHFNLSGETDRWGAKSELFILPALGLGMWFLFKFLAKRAVKINPNKYGAKTPLQLEISKRFMAEMMLFVSLLLAIGVYSIMGIATGKHHNSTYMMAFIGIGLIFIFILYFVRLSNSSEQE